MKEGKRKYSLEFRTLIVFMFLQQAVLWYVQVTDRFVLRYQVQAYFLTAMVLCLLVLPLFRYLKQCRASQEKVDLTFEMIKDGIKKDFSHMGLLKLLLLLLFIFAALSTAFGLDPEKSLFGRNHRYEGLYTLACYYLLCRYALGIKKECERKLLCLIFCVIGVLTSIYGILIMYTGLPDLLGSRWGHTAAVPYSNPNFYSAMITMVVSVSFALFVYAKDKKLCIAGLIAYIAAMFPNFGCKSSSAYVGNIMMFLLFFFMETVIFLSGRKKAENGDPALLKKRFGRHMLSGAVMLVIWICAAFLVKDGSGNSIAVSELKQDAVYADEGMTSDKMFSNRMIIWKYCFERIADYPLLGVGPDNLILITDTPETPEALHVYDKAHNEYINIMISEGIPAVIIYLVFLFAIFIPCMKNWKKNGESFAAQAFFIAFFAYIAQAFFNISVMQVAPYFWIVCGLAANRDVCEDGEH